MPKNDPPKKFFLLAEGGFCLRRRLAAGLTWGGGERGANSKKSIFPIFFSRLSEKGTAVEKLTFLKEKSPKITPQKIVMRRPRAIPFHGAAPAHVTGVHGLLTLLGCTGCSRYWGAPNVHVTRVPQMFTLLWSSPKALQNLQKF